MHGIFFSSIFSFGNSFDSDQLASDKDPHEESLLIFSIYSLPQKISRKEGRRQFMVGGKRVNIFNVRTTSSTRT